MNGIDEIMLNGIDLNELDVFSGGEEY